MKGWLPPLPRPPTTLRTPPRPIYDPQVGFIIFLVYSVSEALSARAREAPFPNETIDRCRPFRAARQGAQSAHTKEPPPGGSGVRAAGRAPRSPSLTALRQRLTDVGAELNRGRPKNGDVVGAGRKRICEGAKLQRWLKAGPSPPRARFINANASASFQPALKPIIKRNWDANCSFSKPCIPNCSEFALSY